MIEPRLMETSTVVGPVQTSTKVPAAWLSPLSASCAALRKLAHRTGFGNSGEARTLLKDLLEQAQAAELELAVKEARIRQLESLSVTDELTGLLNRRGFAGELDKALARAKRSGETGVLVLLDLDHFKPINDTYGHEAGDRVLIAVGRLLLSGIRTADAAARLGGDEFAVLLTDADPQSTQDRLATLRAAVAHLVVDYMGASVPVHASMGHAIYGPSSDAGTLMRMADCALYRAKKSKRVAAE